MRGGWRHFTRHDRRLWAVVCGLVLGSFQFAAAQATRPAGDAQYIRAKVGPQSVPATNSAAGQMAALLAARAQAAKRAQEADQLRAIRARAVGEADANQARIAVQAQIAAAVQARAQLQAVVVARGGAVEQDREPEAFVVRKGDPAVADALAQIDEAAKEQKWE